MDGSRANPSPQLLVANQRLQELRAQVQTQKAATEFSGVGENLAKGTPAWDSASLVKLAIPIETIAALPSHLGWGSESLTAVLRRHLPENPPESQNFDRQPHQEETAVDSIITTPELLSSSQQSTTAPHSVPDWVKLYPDIGLEMLRQEFAAPGRLWLILRYLDKEGQGIVRIDNVSQHLTQKTSTLHLCGQRQLRNLLRDGEGVFWTRDKDRIWLRSAARVACNLGVERLTGQPVALPITALLDGIGTFRAHLYTAFHSGRTKETPYGERACHFDKLRASSERSRRAMPIARETMAELSGVGRSSQRAYEERVGVEVQANFAVGELATKENQEDRAWAQGQALFVLKDYRGQQGKKGKTYLAWQLPNTYLGQHQKRPRGRQKRINRKLKVLVMKGMPGNVEEMSEAQKPEKVYYPSGKLAAKAHGRDPERAYYWPRHRTRNGRFDLWHPLGGE